MFSRQYDGVDDFEEFTDLVGQLCNDFVIWVELFRLDLKNCSKLHQVHRNPSSKFVTNSRSATCRNRYSTDSSSSTTFVNRAVTVIVLETTAANSAGQHGEPKNKAKKNQREVPRPTPLHGPFSHIRRSKIHEKFDTQLCHTFFIADAHLIEGQ